VPEVFYSQITLFRRSKAYDPEYPSGNWIRQLPALFSSSLRRSDVVPLSLSDTYDEEDASKMFDAARGDQTTAMFSLRIRDRQIRFSSRYSLHPSFVQHRSFLQNNAAVIEWIG
jgi:hypothetical protein